MRMEHTVPERYRNRVYAFHAGGYDGCVWHPAALLVTGDGDVALVGSDGGAGGLDEEEWYCKTMRSYLDGKGVANGTELLHAGDKTAYEEFCRFRSEKTAERRDRERKRVAEALEREIGRGDASGWNHEFLEFDVSTPGRVRETCRELCKAFYDQCYPAEMADALRRRGYGGAGVVCSDCGRYFEDTGDFETFAACVDENSYRGIGGLAVAHTRVMCQKCREEATCPGCWEARLPVTDMQRQCRSFGEKFVGDLAGVCPSCAYDLVSSHDRAVEENARTMTNLGIPLKPLLLLLERAEDRGFDPTLAESFRRYAEHQRSEGVPEPEIREAVAEQVLKCADQTFGRCPPGFCEGILGRALEPVVEDFFHGQAECRPRNIEAEWRELLGR